MDPIIEILKQDSRTSSSKIAEMIGESESYVNSKIKELQNKGIILGFGAIIDNEKLIDTPIVSAVIEVKLTPERGGGFDSMANRIAKFDQVVSCYLMSGGYDLAVFVEGKSLKDVAGFVSEKLSALEGIISTVTHFQLKSYKQNNFIFSNNSDSDRLLVTP